jgi:Uma2 family endonuclease
MKVMDKVQELIEVPLSAEDLAVRYRSLCDDPCFANIPGKIEIDLWGRLVMTPASPYHGRVQALLCEKLATLGGETAVETPIATPLGLFVADLSWSGQKSTKAAEFENPLMRAPELCIEVASPSNSRKELREKTEAYLLAGAEEVWIVYLRSKRCEVHAKQGLLERSRFAVDLADLFNQ